jgi:hypothetical protein
MTFRRLNYLLIQVEPTSWAQWIELVCLRNVQNRHKPVDLIYTSPLQQLARSISRTYGVRKICLSNTLNALLQTFPFILPLSLSFGITVPTFLKSALDGGEWLASRSGRFTTEVNRPQHPLVGGYVCPGFSLGGIEKIEIFPLLGIEPKPSNPSLYSLSYYG